MAYAITRTIRKWNDRLSAFVDRDGDWLRGWSNNAQVGRGCYLGSDLEFFAVAGVLDEYVGEDIATAKNAINNAKGGRPPSAMSEAEIVVAAFSGAIDF